MRLDPRVQPRGPGALLAPLRGEASHLLLERLAVVFPRRRISCSRVLDVLLETPLSVQLPLCRGPLYVLSYLHDGSPRP